MKVFVSGATGFIGIQLVKRLAGQGATVHALYRSEEKANLIRIPGVELFRGDILDKGSLELALKGCDQAYHTAAFASVWTKDPAMVFRLNVEGALNVIDAAEKSRIKRVVVTSTAGILGPADKDPVNEDSPPPASFFTLYEESKFQLEQLLSGRKEGSPEVIIVNPTRVYGPGYLSESNGVTRMIKKYIEGTWRMVPGDGCSLGNYVHVEDVVSGHLLAMELGKAGDRYVLGGEDISYNQLFQYTREASGKGQRLIKIPLWIMLITAKFMKAIAGITGKAPLIVPNLVRKFHHNWIVSSQKANKELGYQSRNAKEGIEDTVQWIQTLQK
jgi:farnesol dehydrogenase